MSYGNTWRVHRRLFHRFFNLSVANQFDEKIREAVDDFLRRLSESPERFLKHGNLYVDLSSYVSSDSLRALLTWKPDWVFGLVGCVRFKYRVRG